MALMMRSKSAPSPTVTLRPNVKDVATKVPPGLLVKSLVGRVGLEPTTGGLADYENYGPVRRAR